MANICDILLVFGFDQIYSVNTYSVDWFNLEYLSNCWSDSHMVFGIGFRIKKLRKPCEDRAPSCGEILMKVSLQNKYLYCRTIHYLWDTRGVQV